MRILVVSLGYGETSTSFGYRARGFSEAWFRMGVPVCVLCAAGGVSNGSVEVREVPYWPSRFPVKRIYSRLRWLPEPQTEWVRRSRHALREAVMQFRPTHVFVTTPPHSLQEHSLALSKELPTFADLRDDWITRERYHWWTPFHYFCSKRLERCVVESVQGLIMNTDGLARRFFRRYPDIERKSIVITNGYIEEDFVDAALPRSFEGLGLAAQRCVVYTGSNYDGYTTRLLSWLSHELARRSSTIKIVSAGLCSAETRYAPNWFELGLLPAREAAALQCCATVLLLLMPPGEGEPSVTIPLKTFSYLRAGKPIMYFGPCGATTDLLRQFSGHKWISAKQPEGFLEDLVSMCGTVQPASVPPTLYSMKELAAKALEFMSSRSALNTSVSALR